MPEIEIYRADDRHYEQMFDVHRECFLEEAMHKGLFMEEVEGESRVYFVALDGDKVVGYAGAWNTGTDYSIISVAVTNAYRKNGIAARLINRLITDAKRQGIYSISLEVSEKNIPAYNLYKKLGFITTNVRKSYYKNNTAAYIMWLYL
jgi:ribosomal-protein-alanine N-acetyltransferase